MAPSIIRAAVSLLFVSSTFASDIHNVARLQKRDGAVLLDKRAGVTPTTLPGTWKYQGCYTDPGPRTLSGNSYTSNNAMTDESCISFCDGKGFNYAGTEYSQECYCANSIASTGAVAAASDCSMTCSGNSTEACGGPNRLTVFWNGKAPAAGPTTNPGALGYGLLGCYTEGTNNGRALTTTPQVKGAMTVALCIQACKTAGFSLAGVEYAGECYCGNAFSNGATAAPEGISGCNMACKGNSLEYCGAGNRLDVYKAGTTGTTPASSTTAAAGTSATPSATGPAVVQTVGDFKYYGCQTEGNGVRALTPGTAAADTMTVESCAATCASYSYFGVEYGRECYCGNSIADSSAVAPAGDCNQVCAGNKNEYCGAGNRLNVYVKSGTAVTSSGAATTTGVIQPPATPGSQTAGLPGSWTYQGCYSDNVNGRALFWQVILAANNSATSCLGLCSQYGYMAAGMEYGRECYCGDDSALVASGSTKQAETDCTVPCTGDNNYYCGGGNRLSYYKWTGTPLYTWNKPTGAAAGSYTFLIGGVVVPLITTGGINNKFVFMEKAGTGAPNTTGTYELDLTFINDFSKAWRPLHVKSDIFCSAGITLPDKAGRQLNIGGWSGQSTYGVRLYWPDGSPGVPGVNDWQENVNELSLLAGRWYPSAMVMTNGSVLVMGGEVGSNSAPTPSCEILPLPAGGYAKYLDWLDRTDPNNLYPYMFVLPTGNIFVIYYNEARIISEVTFDTIKTLPNLPGSVSNFLAGRTYPLEGTAVMMPQYPPYSAPVTVLVCGGSANGNGLAVDNCVSTQPEVAAPTWTIERMPSQRVMSCICALPDGTYLILNGATQGVAGFGLAENPNLNAVLYDPSKPVNARMSIMGNTIVARLYHSEAILMPDGRVMVSGSDPQDGKNPEEYRVEVFNPPYILSGATAPSFTIAKSDWAYGGQYTITAKIPSGNTGAVRVSMMAAVSSTHGNSMGQKTLFLTVTCTGAAASATCTLTAPPSAHVAPPGWYQVFVLDGAMPCSQAAWVRIGGSIADAAGLGTWPKYSDFKTPGLGAVGS